MPHLPPHYPAELEQTMVDKNARRYRIRPVLPTDADHLADEIRHADSKTLYMRFFTPKVRLDEERIRYLTEVDYQSRLALVVFVDENGGEGEGVAIARFEGQPGSDTAEVAVTVKPEWRDAGLGTKLVEILEGAALDRGITTFAAMYLAGNEGASGLMAATGFKVDDVDAGIVTVTKHLVAADGP